ncbi:hypothetical protein BX070DRAFT_229585 [Coemansia spiralis]|nr:hypothetical protein BX070DRAFT_229585 [Coemansia spiralis]
MSATTLAIKQNVAKATRKKLMKTPTIWLAFYMGHYYSLMAMYFVIIVLFSALVGLFFYVQDSSGNPNSGIPCNYQGGVMPTVSKAARIIVLAAVACGFLSLVVDRPGESHKWRANYRKNRKHDERIPFRRVVLLCTALLMACAAYSNDVVIWEVFSSSTGLLNQFNNGLKFAYGAACIISILFIIFHLVNGGTSATLLTDEELNGIA